MFFFFFNDTATTEIYTLSLHDALPISIEALPPIAPEAGQARSCPERAVDYFTTNARSEEHTSELQSLAYLVCRLLLEKKKKKHLIILSLPTPSFTNTAIGYSGAAMLRA